MLRRLAAAVWLCVLASAQQVLIQGMNHHPAAGPDLVQHDLARSILNDGFLAAPDGRIEGIVEEEARKFIEPLKQHTYRREESLRREAEEIAKLLRAEREPEKKVDGSTWLWSMVGCAAVVSCGIVPAFLLPANSGEFLQSEDGRRKLNLLLSFAVGSLLGDVFLHLLPETWAGYGVKMDSIGLWTMSGLLVCFLVEKLCASTEESQHRICAIMNLFANVVDNFTHGLAVGGSFLVSTKFGFLTTAAILLHEIPHEISDFAILLRADYDRWSALKAQAITASAGVLGSCAALWLNTDTVVGGAAGWILPFTAGGFINIALAQILPELMEETDQRQNLKQLVLILSGVAVMGFLNQFHV